jgi:hypothetical protein
MNYCMGVSALWRSKTSRIYFQLIDKALSAFLLGSGALQQAATLSRTITCIKDSK